MLYRLVQVSRQFYKKLIEVLVVKLEFIKCLNDPCLLMKENENGIIIICLYIDDTLYVREKLAIKKFKKQIREYFVTKEEGTVNEYVGCMIKRVNGGVYLHQTDLIKTERRNLKKISTTYKNIQYWPY